MRELWQSTPRGPVTTDESNILQSIERDEGEGDLSFQFFHNDQDILQPFNNNGDSDGEEKDEEHKEDLPFDESFVNPSFVDPHDIEKEKPGTGGSGRGTKPSPNNDSLWQTPETSGTNISRYDQ